jgi:hypothetical protein
VHNVIVPDAEGIELIVSLKQKFFIVFNIEFFEKANVFFPECFLLTLLLLIHDAGNHFVSVPGRRPRRSAQRGDNFELGLIFVIVS